MTTEKKPRKPRAKKTKTKPLFPAFQSALKNDVAFVNFTPMPADRAERAIISAGLAIGVYRAEMSPDRTKFHVR